MYILPQNKMEEILLHRMEGKVFAPAGIYEHQFVCGRGLRDCNPSVSYNATYSLCPLCRRHLQKSLQISLPEVIVSPDNVVFPGLGFCRASDWDI